jgi:Phage Mu protein F like protein
MMLTPLFQAALPVGIRVQGTWPQYRYETPDRLVFDGYMVTMDAPPTITKIDRELKKWGDKWQRKFDKLSRDASKKFATRSFGSTDVALKAALKKAGFTVSFKPTRKSMQAYKLVVADNVGLIRNLQQSLYNKIQQDTWASVRAGGDMGALSAKLHKSYGIEANRAALIARDQNNKAKATLEAARRQELGLKQAIWQHSNGGKEPRRVHLAWGREGKVFDLDKGLYDPDEGQWVLPGTLIRCRCTSRAIIPGFDD